MSAASPLLLLAVPSTSRLLAALAAGPCSLAELQRGSGSPPATTIRGYLRSLAAAGVVEKRRHGGFPGAFDYRLTAAGSDLRKVEEVLGEWLAASPREEIALGSLAAKRSIRALVESWGTGLARALAPGSLSLTELAAAVPGLSYPGVERRLSSMRRLGLVQAVPGPGTSTVFAAADWMRLALAPLAAAVRWQREQRHQTVPIDAADLELALLLVSPGLPRLKTEPGGAGIAVRALDGGIVSCVLEIGSRPAAWARGSPDAWVSAILDLDPCELELGGETERAAAMVGEYAKSCARGSPPWPAVVL